VNFSQKRTCKSCQFDASGTQTGKCQAGVKNKAVTLGAHKPLEPCYKPLTSTDYKVHMDRMMDTLAADLAIHRASE
jgi:hypothetical protein